MESDFIFSKIVVEGSQVWTRGDKVYANRHKPSWKRLILFWIKGEDCFRRLCSAILEQHSFLVQYWQLYNTRSLIGGRWTKRTKRVTLLSSSIRPGCGAADLPLITVPLDILRFAGVCSLTGPDALTRSPALTFIENETESSPFHFSCFRYTTRMK